MVPILSCLCPDRPCILWYFIKLWICVTWAIICWTCRALQASPCSNVQSQYQLIQGTRHTWSLSVKQSFKFLDPFGTSVPFRTNQEMSNHCSLTSCLCLRYWTSWYVSVCIVICIVVCIGMYWHSMYCRMHWYVLFLVCTSWLLPKRQNNEN